MFNGTKVLVTGGTGFIGVNLIIRLLSMGCQIRATFHNRPPVIHSGAIEYVKADLTSMEDCRRVVDGVDYVFMCAAITSGAGVIASTPLVHVTPNVVMNVQMLEAAYHAHVKKFLYISSNAAYPPTGDRPVREDEMFNGDPYEAYFAAGWMKRYTEILCRMYSEKLKNGMSTVVVRPSNIYGPYDDFNFATSHVMSAMIRKVVERHDPIELWGMGDDVRDLIYIDDFIDAILLATDKLDTYDPINIGLGKGYRINEILKIILDVDGYTNANIRYDPSKPAMIPIRLIDITKAEKLIGFRAKIDISDGIFKTVQWYRKSVLAN